MKTLSVKNSWFSESDLRLDASFHLSDGPLTKLKLRKSPYPITFLRDECDRIFSGNIFKRTFVSDPKHGWPYLTGSDMIKSDISSGKYISKKHTAQVDNLRINKSWILISCSGTLGNTVFTNDDFEGRVGTHDLIRAIPNEKNTLKGYLYAYLSSKFGYGLLTQSSYGGVVKHIEPQHIKDLPIPILPKPKQQEIHNLIVEASNLRIDGNCLMMKIQSDLLQKCGLNKLNLDDYEYYGTHYPNREARVFTVKKTNLSSVSFKAFNYSKKLNEIKTELERSVKTLPLRDVIHEKGIYHSSAFKRVELKNGGVELLSQKDIFKFHISGKKISKIFPKTTDVAEENEILISGVGSMGEGDAFCRTILAKDSVIGKVVAGEFLRMKAKKIPYGYLYSWLSSELVYRLLRSYGTGTTLIRPIEKFVSKIPVPIFDNEFMSIIHNKANLALESIELSRKKEKESIDLVEKEIESWQK